MSDHPPRPSRLDRPADPTTTGPLTTGSVPGALLMALGIAVVLLAASYPAPALAGGVALLAGLLARRRLRRRRGRPTTHRQV